MAASVQHERRDHSGLSWREGGGREEVGEERWRRMCKRRAPGESGKEMKNGTKKNSNAIVYM